MKIESKSLTGFLALMFACLPLFYLFRIDPIFFHIGTLVFLLSLVALSPGSRVSREGLGFLTLVYLLIVISAIREIGGQIDIFEYFKWFAFGLQMLLLLSVVGRDNVDVFFSKYANWVSVVSVLQIFLMLTGGIDDHYGRYFFFGDSHPNLGGEIYTIALLFGALSLGRNRFLVIFLPMFICLLMMQVRSSELVVIGILIAKVFFDSSNQVKAGRVVGVVTILMLVSGALLIEGSMAQYFMAKVMLADDAFRGSGTGLVGRVERWSIGIEYALANPLLGSGISTYTADDALSPHNAFLYGFSMCGAFSLLFWWFIAGAVVRASKRDRRVALYTAPFLILFLLNDRFINLNPYPFLLYFSVIRLGERSLLKDHTTRLSVKVGRPIDDPVASSRRA